MLLCACPPSPRAEALEGDDTGSVTADATSGDPSEGADTDRTTTTTPDLDTADDDSSTSGFPSPIDSDSTGVGTDETTAGAETESEGGTCEPNTCARAGVQCGSMPDGCGGTMNCGGCGPGESCSQGLCQCVPSCGGLQCGLDPQCGVSCGTCGVGTNCQAGTCVSNIQVLDQIASADNLVLVSSTDPAQANTAYPSSNLAVGCTWVYSALTNIQSYVCASSLVYFDVNAILANASISSARLVFELDYTPASPTNYSVWAVATDWFANVTWNTQPLVVVATEQVIGSPVSSVIPWEIDVTSIVQAWANGTYPNRGFLLESASYLFPYATLYQSTGMCSLESCPGDFRPRLVVEYQ